MGPTLLLALALAAASEKPSAQLHYDGPDKGPRSEEALIAAVAARLGYDPFRPDAGLKVQVEFEEGTVDCRAAIGMKGADGSEQGRWQRKALAGYCSELFDELALAISLAIDPLLGATPAPTRTATPALVRPPPPPPPTPVAPPKPAEPEPAPAGHLRFFAGAGAVFDATPSATVGFRFGAEYAWPRFALALDGRAYWPTTLEIEERNEASVFLARGELSPCLRQDEFSLCLAATLGALRASGDSLSPKRVATTAFAGTGLKAGMDFGLFKSLVLRAEIYLELALTRTTIVANGAEVWTQAPLFGGLDIAVLFGEL